MRSPNPLPPDHPDAPTSTPPLPPRLTASGLWSLAEVVDAAFADGDPRGNALLRVALPTTGEPSRAGTPAVPPPPAVIGPTDELELGLRPLDDDHPLDLLLGFVAPDDWLALGVTCQGRALSLDPGSTAPPEGRAADGPARGEHVVNDRAADGAVGDRAPRGDAEPVRITLLLERSGAGVGLLRRGGQITRLGDPPDGTVADACRRALGLPTAPAAGSTSELWTLWWLDRLVTTAIEPGSGSLVDGWAQVAALHPAAWLPVSSGPRRRHGGADAAWTGRSPGRLGVGPEPDVLAAAALALADAWPWGRLRADPGAPEIPGAAPGLELAAWMDDGMFARWLLSSFPSCGDLFDAAAAVLPDGLAARVGAVVEATLDAPRPAGQPPLSSSAS